MVTVANNATVLHLSIQSSGAGVLRVCVCMCVCVVLTFGWRGRVVISLGSLISIIV